MTTQTTLPAQCMTCTDCEKTSRVGVDDPGLITVDEIRRVVEDAGSRMVGS